MGQKREREREREREPDSDLQPLPDQPLGSESEPTSISSPIQLDVGMVKKQVNRCSGCRRKVGLIGFRCRCGDLFCWEHRYSDRHGCGFDYKASGRDAIARENPVVRPAKILKV